MTTTIRIGFIPLLDAAALICARDEGFAEAEGLALDLVREVSWANIRDKLNVGLFDAAHILTPAAIASSLGLGHVTVPMVVPANLNLNGNAITVSRQLYDQLAADADGDLTEPAVSARALKRICDRRRAAGEAPPTFAKTFPFSMHHYHLRIWMKSGGVNPEEDVRLVVIPPPLMARSLESGHIDGFCVGAPWNALTVAGGGAVVLHLGTQIVSDCPEKALGVLSAYGERHPPIVAALVRALVQAGRWCTEPANRPLLSRHMARADVLGVSPQVLETILAGTLPLGGRAPGSPTRDYIRFDPAALRPEAAQADFLFDQMVDAGQTPDDAGRRRAARKVLATDLFDAACGDVGGSVAAPRLLA